MDSRLYSQRVRRLLLPLVAVAFSLSAVAQTPQQWRDSLATLNKQIAEHPQSTDLRLKKAALNIELSQWEYAIEEYGRVLQIDDKNLSAFYFRAYAHNQLRHYHMAQADYESFLAIMPRHFSAQLGLAMTKRKMGKTIETQDELNRLVEMYPDSAMAFAARASFEQEQRQYDLSLYDWDQALRLSPDNVEYRLSKYTVLWAMRRYDEARRLYESLAKSGVSVDLLKRLQSQ